MIFPLGPVGIFNVTGTRVVVGSNLFFTSTDVSEPSAGESLGLTGCWSEDPEPQAVSPPMARTEVRTMAPIVLTRRAEEEVLSIRLTLCLAVGQFKVPEPGTVGPLGMCFSAKPESGLRRHVFRLENRHRDIVVGVRDMRRPRLVNH